MSELIVVALKAYIAEKQARAFAFSMARMAQDPHIQRESALITVDFLPMDANGLSLLE